MVLSTRTCKLLSCTWSLVRGMALGGGHYRNKGIACAGSVLANSLPGGLTQYPHVIIGSYSLFSFCPMMILDGYLPMLCEARCFKKSRCPRSGVFQSQAIWLVFRTSCIEYKNQVWNNTVSCTLKKNCQIITNFHLFGISSTLRSNRF